MSFPNIPDINPYINLTLEDSINLLLTSIALEEISLSNLIDAEKCKIMHVVQHCKECKHEDKHDECKHDHKHCKCTNHVQDAIAINESVDKTIKDIIKMQMLLQFKLENIVPLITTSTTTTSTSTSTTTTCTKTTTHTTTSTTTTCTTTTKVFDCSLIGRGKGCVTNKCDSFYCSFATIQAYIINNEFKNRFFRYYVKNDTQFYNFTAQGHHIIIDCPSCLCSYKVLIRGKGQVELKTENKPDVSGMARFELMVWDRNNGDLEFKIDIKSSDNPELNHDSGFVRVDGCDSSLRLES